MKTYIKKMLPIIMVLAIFTISGCGKQQVTDTNEPSTSTEKKVINESAKFTDKDKADYSSIPVYSLDGKKVNLNASDTPLQFFAVWCHPCQEDLPKIQETVEKLQISKSPSYVATFFKTSDINDAIKQTKEFIETYKIKGIVYIQLEQPQKYTNSVPTLITLTKGQTEPQMIKGMPSQEQLLKIFQ